MRQVVKSHDEQKWGPNSPLAKAFPPSILDGDRHAGGRAAVPAEFDWLAQLELKPGRKNRLKAPPPPFPVWPDQRHNLLDVLK
jgi:hypothetical protein